MPEEDAKVFQDAFGIYNKYRWTEMQSDAQWEALWADLKEFAEAHRWRESVLARAMVAMLTDVFCEMYRGGKKPVIPDYFGRSDL